MIAHTFEHEEKFRELLATNKNLEIELRRVVNEFRKHLSSNSNDEREASVTQIQDDAHNAFIGINRLIICKSQDVFLRNTVSDECSPTIASKRKLHRFVCGFIGSENAPAIVRQVLTKNGCLTAQILIFTYYRTSFLYRSMEASRNYFPQFDAKPFDAFSSQFQSTASNTGICRFC